MDSADVRRLINDLVICDACGRKVPGIEIHDDGGCARCKPVVARQEEVVVELPPDFAERQEAFGKLTQRQRNLYLLYLKAKATKSEVRVSTASTFLKCTRPEFLADLRAIVAVGLLELEVPAT